MHEKRLVVDVGELELRMCSGERSDDLLGPGGDRHRAARGLAADADQHRGLAVGRGAREVLAHRRLDMGDVAERDRDPVVLGDHDLRKREQIGPAVMLDPAEGAVDEDLGCVGAEGGAGLAMDDDGGRRLELA